MLEYVILFIFIGIILYPLQMNPAAKIIELILVVYAGYKNPLIGLFCAIVFMYSMSIKPVDVKPDPISRVMDRILPKDSNQTVCTGKTNENDYSPNEPYTAYNVEV